MKRYSPTLILSLIYLLSILPQFFNDSTVIVNWVWKEPRPMPLPWAVRFTVDELMWVLFAEAAYLYGRYRNKVNRVSMLVFELWCIFNLISYFYNYKTFGFFASYFWIPVAWLLIYYWGSKYSERLWQILHNRQ